LTGESRWPPKKSDRGDAMPLQDLVRAARHGDPLAREDLARRLRDAFTASARHQLGPKLLRVAELDDVVQESMLRIAANSSPLLAVDDAGIQRWARRVVHNVIHDLHDQHVRAEKRDVRRLISLSDVDTDDPRVRAAFAIEADGRPLPDATSDREVFERAAAAIRLLPEDEAYAVRRIKLEGECIAAVARELALGESTVRMRLARGLARIGQRLGQDLLDRHEQRKRP
jgi:RNA polymerase sigma-70 factor (ECF subfamily)